MSKEDNQNLRESGNVQTMLNTVIQTGKSHVGQLGGESIAAFIAGQEGVDGAVTLSNIRGGGDVGASSGIVIFTASYRYCGEWVTRDLVLRYAPSSDMRLFFYYDLGRQFRVQKAMFQQGLPVPEPLWLDADGSVLGIQGFIMQFKEGVAPHPSAFVSGPLAEASAEDRRRMLEQIHRALVTIHNTDIKAFGLEDFAMEAPGDEAFERCINWYWKTWEWINIPEYSKLVGVRRWLLANMPAGKPELTHGDATLHNYMFHSGQLVAVIDWEMSCLGRAEADLALQCVGNRLFAAPADSGALQPPSETEWLEMYREAGGREVRDFEYYKIFAAYMVIVAVGALQRNLPTEDKAAQAGLLQPLWEMLEGVE